MSTDRQRLKSAIQQIANEAPEIRELLGEGQNKGGKASSAGVGVSDAERDRICCDGSTSDSANPGTEEREVGNSQSGLDPNDPADIGGGDGTLSDVTDCATGDPVCFEGAGFISPDEWDAPNDPPLLDVYYEGYYWTYTKDLAGTCGEVTYTTLSLEDLAIFFQQENKACSDNDNSFVEPYYRYDGYDSQEDRHEGQFGARNSAGNLNYVINISSERCATSHDAVCDEDPPVAESWPSDGCTNLAIVNGKIVGSKYDPENDGSYSAPRDSIDLCDSEGNQISLAPAANVGWKTINSTTNNGYLYDSSGKQIAHIDGNEYSDPSV